MVPTTADAPLTRALHPFQRFARMEAAGGIVLLTCTVVALVWANSSWASTYHHLWDIPLTIGVPGAQLTLSLHQWVNDGLMAVFFFVVGLEIKREVLVGELASRRTAALPLAAALGGMVVPALLYAGLNAGGDGGPGWGIPMATDIAFALGVLALLGSRVPLGLKVFLAALAIADDIGAVLVIALFYTNGLSWEALAWAGGVLGSLILANYAGARHAAIYAILGVALWLFVHASGVHATVAGVLLAFTIPARTMIDPDEFIRRAEASLADLRNAASPGATVLTSRAHQEAVQMIESLCEAVQAPLPKMEHKLHGIVAFGIIPLFALANAGVPLSPGTGAGTSRITLGVIVGLLLGKPIGIMLASWLAVRSRIADLPAGVSWGSVHGAAWLGGIGFTMSIFIAGLAFDDAVRLSAAKLGVLTASLGAGFVGWGILAFVGARNSRRDERSVGHPAA